MLQIQKELNLHNRYFSLLVYMPMGTVTGEADDSLYKFLFRANKGPY